MSFIAVGDDSARQHIPPSRQEPDGTVPVGSPLPARWRAGEPRTQSIHRHVSKETY